ncbi:MAG: cell division protein FtsZ [Betaproteobacteria bacterium]|nr:cell division protein FtsZ [Betaproteobacteria bacterium]
MSDLQISLLIIGAVVIGGIYLFNWFQERQLRRKLGQAFDGERDDVLLKETAPGAVKVEPQMRDAAELEAAARPTPEPQSRAPELPAAPGFDETIDFIGAIDAETPIASAVVDELLGRIAACGTPSRSVGLNESTDAWEALEHNAGNAYAHLRLALQLANRSGPVSAAQLMSFCEAIRIAAERAGARARLADTEAALAAARQLDAFCAEVDIAIGINIVARDGESFNGTRIRAHVEAAGFKLEPSGVFHYRNDQRQTLFTLDNHEPAPFLPEQIKSLNTRGLTLLLDVPRVENGVAVLRRMFEVGKGLALALGGRMVDDNRVPLNEAGITKISQQVAGIQETMQSRGVSAGSERALRLFS